MDENTIAALRKVADQAQTVADALDVPYPPGPAGFQTEVKARMPTGLERHPDPPLAEIRGKLTSVATSIKDYLRDRGL
jgi:hypothetical protein